MIGLSFSNEFMIEKPKRVAKKWISSSLIVCVLKSVIQRFLSTLEFKHTHRRNRRSKKKLTWKARNENQLIIFFIDFNFLLSFFCVCSFHLWNPRNGYWWLFHAMVGIFCVIGRLYKTLINLKKYHQIRNIKKQSI